MSNDEFCSEVVEEDVYAAGGDVYDDGTGCNSDVEEAGVCDTTR